jgi:uncharacterized protein YegJ (DUF2314 family)
MLYLLIALLFLSCDKLSAPDASGRPSPVIEVERSDKEIERITENARRALPVFFRNLARPEAGAGNFYLKYPLTSEDGGAEQVWLGNIRFKNGNYYGTLSNTAKFINSVKKSKTITIDTDKITDWMYIQDGKIMGGRSIKYLMEKMPEDQRGEDRLKILRMFD